MLVAEFSVEECPKAPNSGPALFRFDHGDGTRHPDFNVVSDIWNYWYRSIRIENQLCLMSLPCWRN